MTSSVFFQESLSSLQTIRYEHRQDIHLPESTQKVKHLLDRLREDLGQDPSDAVAEIDELVVKVRDQEPLSRDEVEKVWQVFAKTSIQCIFSKSLVKPSDGELVSLNKYEDLFPYFVRTLFQTPVDDRYTTFQMIDMFFGCGGLSFGQKIQLAQNLGNIPIQSKQSVIDFIKSLIAKYPRISFMELELIITSLGGCSSSDILEMVDLCSIFLSHDLYDSLKVFNAVVFEINQIEPSDRKSVLVDLKSYMDFCPRHKSVHLPNMIVLLSAIEKNKRVTMLMYLPSITKQEGIGIIPNSLSYLNLDSQELFFLGQCLSEIAVSTDESRLYLLIDSLDAVLTFLPLSQRIEMIKALSFFPVDLNSLNYLCVKLQTSDMIQQFEEQETDICYDRDWNEHSDASVGLLSAVSKSSCGDAPSCPFLVKRLLIDIPEFKTQFVTKLKERLDKHCPYSHKVYFSNYLIYYKNTLLAINDDYIVSKARFSPMRQVMLSLNHVLESIDQGADIQRQWSTIPKNIRDRVYHTVYLLQKTKTQKNYADPKYGEKAFNRKIEGLSDLIRKEAVSKEIIRILSDELLKEGYTNIMESISLLQEDVQNKIFMATAKVCSIPEDQAHEARGVFLGEDGFGEDLIKEIRSSAMRKALVEE